MTNKNAETKPTPRYRTVRVPNGPFTGDPYVNALLADGIADNERIVSIYKVGMTRDRSIILEALIERIDLAPAIVCRCDGRSLVHSGDESCPYPGLP